MIFSWFVGNKDWNSRWNTLEHVLRTTRRGIALLLFQDNSHPVWIQSVQLLFCFGERKDDILSWRCDYWSLHGSSHTIHSASVTSRAEIRLVCWTVPSDFLVDFFLTHITPPRIVHSACKEKWMISVTTCLCVEHWFFVMLFLIHILEQSWSNTLLHHVHISQYPSLLFE